MSLNRQTAGHLVYQKHRPAMMSIVWFLGLLMSDQQLNGLWLKIFNCQSFSFFGILTGCQSFSHSVFIFFNVLPFALGKTHKSRIFPEKRHLDVWGRGFCLVTFLLPLKHIDFSQLINRCWLELDMSSLDVTESGNRPILVDGDHTSWISEDRNRIVTKTYAPTQFEKKSIFRDFRY